MKGAEKEKIRGEPKKETQSEDSGPIGHLEKDLI